MTESSSYRGKNHALGAKGEERIREILEEYAQVESTGDRYPDLLMTFENGLTFGVECKTIKSVNAGNGGRKGNVKISNTEIAGMNALPEREIIPCMICEIRPPRGPQNRYYLFIEWERVRAKYNQKSPVTASLPFYWIHQNGLNLRAWLVRQTQTIEVT